MAQDEAGTVHYEGPAGGWYSVRGIAETFGKE